MFPPLRVSSAFISVKFCCLNPRTGLIIMQLKQGPVELINIKFISLN